MGPASPDQVAVVAVGSNLAPLRHIPRAAIHLARKGRLVATSTFYTTDPLGPPGQPPFVNGVWLIATASSPDAVKGELLALETDLGRVHSEDRYAPRPIDLDLILYNDVVCTRPELHLPHPDLARVFVCEPLREILAAAPACPYRAYWLGLLGPAHASPCGRPLFELTARLRDLCVG